MGKRKTVNKSNKRKQAVSKIQTANQKPTVNKKHKDRLFRLIFNNKKDLLELYNAVNNTDYRNADELTITTLDDVIFMRMKNDLSFLIAGTLNLYEHQSTVNKNMPFRSLIYLAKLFQDMVDTYKINPYSSKLQKIPTPQCIVFYNGLQAQDEYQELRLSEAFEKTEEEPALELIVKQYNINLGANEQLLNRCQKLKQYAQFIAKIREYLNHGMDISESVEKAIDQCIKDDVLTDILKRARVEVYDMVLEEYDEEYHIREEKKLSYAQGLQAGIRIFIADKREDKVPENQIQEKVMKFYHLSEEEAKQYLAEN